MLGKDTVEKAKEISASTPVNDLSSFVKRKAKPSTKDEDNKKPKLE